MDKKKIKELMEQILKYCDQCYSPNWQPKSFEEFVKLGNICREAIKEIDKSGWVSVEDGLPPYKEKVFACDKQMKDYPFVTMRYNTDEKNVLDKNGFRSGLHVTHWKPIEKLEE